MSYRFLNPAPVFFNIPGTKPASGGSLTFYQIGTTTPKTTWSNQAMSVPNSNPVLLDASGRSNTSIWLDGDYSVVLKDGDGVTVWTRDVTSGFSASASIPALVADYFLTNDGSNLIWQPILQLPDPTGSDGYMLTTDGANFLWTPQPAPPEIPTPDILIQTTPNFKFQAGVSDNTTKYVVQTGSASAPSTGTRSTVTGTITFPTAFSAPPFVSLSPTSQSNAGGPMCWELTSVSNTGFAAQWTIAAGAGIDAKILNAVPYAWRAEGAVVIIP